MTGRLRCVAVLLLAGLGARGQAPDAPADEKAPPRPAESLPVAEPLLPGPPDGPVVRHDVDGGRPWEGEGRLGSGLELWGDYLFLKPRRDGLDFAVVAATRVGLPSGSVEPVDYESRSGFRAGLGWRLPSDWSVGVGYTYLHSDGSRVLGAPRGGALFATTARAGGIDDVAAASASANLDYNVIDLEASRRVEVNDTFDLRVFGGGRFAWIDQKFDALYNGGSAAARDYRVGAPTSFRGAGVTAGGEGTWRLYRGLGLYARARGSLLSGEVRDARRESNAGLTVVDLREKRYRVVPALEMGVGVALEWEHLHLKVGYELTDWLGLIDSPDLPDGTGVGRVGRRPGDLTLEGLAVQLGLTF